jgi:uncharacterized protein
MEEFNRLLDEGADFNTQNEFGLTPLMLAAKKGDLNLVKFLAKHTRDLNLEDKDGNSALYYALSSNSIECVQILCENGAKVTDFIYMCAISSNKKNIVRFFDSLK